MANTTLQVFSILFILTTVVLIYFVRLVQSRRARSVLRPISSFNALPMWIGRAIEANRPLHLSLGSAGVGGDSTILALAGAEVFYYIIQDATIGDVSPIITTTSTATIPLGQDTLRRAYQSRKLSKRFKAANARWYPAGQRSIAFAAALTTLTKVENPSSHVLMGSFGPELALILDTAHHEKQPVFAASDQIEGQAIAFALADDYLIGEEIFAAPGYLSDSPGEKAESIVVDLWRILLVLTMIALLVLSLQSQLGG